MNTITNLISRVVLLCVCVMSLVACQSLPERDPAYAAVRPVALPPLQNNSGSIYQAGYDVRLFEDSRARRVGDLLTINLVESTNASKQAATELSKTTDTSVANPTILGTTPQFNTPGILPLASNKNNNLGFGLSSSNDFEGDGSSSQSNSLKGSITVTVAEVLPNGYLVVRGEKVTSLNQGHEYVRLSGIVRPTDIRPDNTVLSTQIADAQIAYTGSGAVAETNTIGWLARFFISALFPF
ncbi:flagellar basal body L-ring protein FlgH [Sulfuriflexus mobilis]|uniref:flagellar basal body L-ring protein FlgH n=1 Tax=Sulfuriflexus mobilis TaxID=1811807 RepID=UPI000F84647A|nr:flagellar basal body L-ring protein FlgH [Sulfuriflexus mobilis]